MTLPALLARIGWSNAELQRRTGYSKTTVEAWRRGVNRHGSPYAPPADVLAWLQRVADAIDAEPAPSRNP